MLCACTEKHHRIPCNISALLTDEDEGLGMCHVDGICNVHVLCCRTPALVQCVFLRTPVLSKQADHLVIVYRLPPP